MEQLENLTIRQLGNGQEKNLSNIQIHASLQKRKENLFTENGMKTKTNYNKVQSTCISGVTFYLLKSCSHV